MGGFIRRCWYPSRGCGESSECTDIRELFRRREMTTRLPPPKECGRPKYIVEGATMRSRNGVMDGNDPSRLIFPGEQWYKCCLHDPDGAVESNRRLTCEKAHTIPMEDVTRYSHGMCGVRQCTGMRDRCLA